MAKSADAFRSIGEVARLIGVAPHVLRYWEAQFPQLSPVKRADGRRYYRPDDVRLAAGLCVVMRDEGMTARGAARLMEGDKGVGLRARGEQRLTELLAAAPVQAEARSPRAARQSGPKKPSLKPRHTVPDLPLFPQNAPVRADSPLIPPPVQPAAMTALSERFAVANDGLRRLRDPLRHHATLSDLATRLRAHLAAR